MSDDYLDEMITLFNKYRESFGLSNDRFPELDPQERQCEFEEKFVDIICKAKGHDIGPDQCGIPEHDLCYRCQELRVDIEKDTVKRSK